MSAATASQGGAGAGPSSSSEPTEENKNFECNICGAMRASYVLNPEKDAQGNPKQAIPLSSHDLKKPVLYSVAR